MRGRRARVDHGLLTSDGAYTITAAFTVLDGCLGHFVHDNALGGFTGDDFYAGIVREVVRCCLGPVLWPRTHA